MNTAVTIKRLMLVLLLLALSIAANAQFTGPGTSGNGSTVAQIGAARMGSYVTVTGHIVDHQRKDYFTFRDGSGEIRVEIEADVWRNRPVTPETKVRLLAEIDQGPAGRYLWVKSLEIIE